MSSVASWESLSGWDVFERQRWQGDTRWPHVMRTCSKSEKTTVLWSRKLWKALPCISMAQDEFQSIPTTWALQRQCFKHKGFAVQDVDCGLLPSVARQPSLTRVQASERWRRAIQVVQDCKNTARDCKRLQDQMGTLLHIPIPWSILHRFAARFLGMGFAAGACPSGMSGIHIRNYHDMDQIVLRCQTFVGITVWILQEAALLGVVFASWACSLQRSGRDKWHKCTAPVWLLLDR